MSKLVEEPENNRGDTKGAKQYEGADTPEKKTRLTQNQTRVQGQKVDKSIEGVCKTCPKTERILQGFCETFLRVAAEAALMALCRVLP